VWDTPRLILIKTPKGVIRYAYRYTVPHSKTEKGRVTETSVGKPGITLNKAKEGATKYAEFLRDGIDPQEAKKWHPREGTTFQQMAEQWIALNKPRWSESRLREITKFIYEYGKPLLNLRVGLVQPENVAKAIAPLLKTAPSQAERVLSVWAQVMNRAMALKMHPGLKNPASWKDTQRYLHPRQPRAERKHFRAMDYKNVPAFLSELRQHRAPAAVALEFLTLTAMRTYEVLGAEWSEINLDERVWNVPASRMKYCRPHRVPLAPRAFELLKRQKEYDTDYVFTGHRRDKPLAIRQMWKLLKQIDPKATVHGFRSTFRDWAGDIGNFAREDIEFCLAHLVGGLTEQAYRRSDALDKRRVIMNAWAEYCG
jgi:integrase